MTTYADPTRCPDCRATLPHDPQVCQACQLPLTGPTAAALFTAFTEADRLLGVLRSQKRPVPVSVGAAPTATPVGASGLPPFPVSAPRPTSTPRGPRLRGASVPKILLTLGALCLLVAALIFLAVAWQWLGVGGRTAVLVLLTAVSFGLTLTFHRRGLRTAAEALSVVGLGLLALDLSGMRHAGWLGPIDDSHLALLVGAVVATASLVLLVATSRRPLVAAGVIAPFATVVGGFGAQVDVESLLPMVLTVAALLGLVRVGTVLPSRTLQAGSLAFGSLTWLGLVLAAAFSFEGLPLTLGQYVGHGGGWPLLAATVLAAVAGPVTGLRGTVTTIGYAVAGLAGSYTLLLPVLDNAPIARELATLTVAALWVVAVMAAPARLRSAALLPLAGTLVLPVVAAYDLVATSLRALVSVGDPFSRPFGVELQAATTQLSPLVLVPTFLVVAAAGCACWSLAEPLRRTAWALALATAAAAGSIAALPLYDVPLALVVGILVAAAVAAHVTAYRLGDRAAAATRLTVLVLTTGTAVLALPSDRMVTAVLLVACAMAASLLARTDTTGAVAALCFPIAFAAVVWAGGNAVGIDEAYRAVPVLVVLGGLAIWRPQLELEASSAFAATMVSAGSVMLARDVEASLAVHLTLAGALVTATSIIHPSRRMLGWAGGLLLAAATWVRLLDLGVHVPEAYTLPSAIALVVVGGWRLRTDDDAATLTELLPGLTLATVPSLLAMLHDPYSLRALLLGAGCLALVVVGAVRRWSAPVVVGAVVGGLLALREVAPYAAEVPSWISLGSAGALLLVVGITWESRMNDVRRASRYVAALR